MKQNARKKSREAAKMAEEQKKQGLWGMSKYTITRREKCEDRKEAAAANCAEAEATTVEDCDSAVVDEDFDKGALDAMVLVEADHGTKEAEKEADVKKNNKLNEAKKLVAVKAQLKEIERTERPAQLRQPC